MNRRVVDGPLGVRYLERRATMRPLLPRESSDVFIDGFPRSANSYAFYAFQVANPDAHVSGHCHSAAALRRALALGVPTMVLLREPRACVASLIRFVPGLSVYAALGHYRRFHQRVLSLDVPFFVARFADVIDDLGKVLDHFNAAMDTSFESYVKSDQNEARVRSVLEQANLRYAGGGEHTAAIPSQQRSPLEDVIGNLGPRERRRLDECLDLYRALEERQ